MSVIGFDIGNESCVIAVAKRGGIDVLLNDEAKRETPSVVSFGDKQRFFGSAGAAFATSNPKSTISQIKRLIGRLYNEPSVQADLKLLPFVTSEGPRGGIVVELDYLNTKWTFTPVEILGMLFTHLKQMTEKNLESPVVDCVIGIPSYFTDLQRRKYLDAARIAGLRPLRLIHDGTAIALGYGMYKNEFSKSGSTVVVFVDIGHCDTQVTVAAFEQGGMVILSHSFDSNLGGRDFDEVLFRHFAAQFKEKYKIDVYSNARSSIRLRASCEKMKKVLSANTEAPISIECLIDDTDVRGVIKREEFEKLSQELLERVNVSCIKAVEDSGISVDKIYTIELVGSGSRIPAITKIIAILFNKEPTRTLNASECVARGCALRCAMLSPSQIVRDYKVEDVFPYSIEIPLDEVKNEKHLQFMLFRKGNAFPRYKTITNTGSRFYFHVSYTENKDFPAGVSTKVGRFGIGSSETFDPEKPKVDVTMKLNDHGIVVIESASVLEGKHSVRRTIQSYEKNFEGSSHTSNLEFSENLDVATTEDELREAREREQMLAEQDKKVEETKDQRNTLESFVYDTRSKLSSAYRNFASDSEKKVITDSLQETEDWLYEDSDDESEQDYTGKLQNLKKLLDPVEKRYKHEKARAQATKALQTRIEKYRSYASSLPPIQKEKILYECSRVEQWLNNLTPHSCLVDENTVHWIEEAKEIFQRICVDVIRSKPKSLKHHEFVNSNQRDRSVMNSDQRDQSVDSEQRDQSVDSDQRDRSVDSDQRDRSVDSGQKSQPADSDQKSQPADSDQKSQPADSDQKSQPADSDQKSQPADSDQKSQTADSEQKVQPADSTQKGHPVDLTQKGQPVDSSRNVRPTDSVRKVQPLDLDCKGQPEDLTRKGQTTNLAQKGHFADSAKKCQPVDFAHKGQPGDSGQTGQPVDSNQMDQLEDMQID